MMGRREEDGRRVGEAVVAEVIVLSCGVKGMDRVVHCIGRGKGASPCHPSPARYSRTRLLD